MKTIKFDQIYKASTPITATIGYFDGVHQGHKYLISKLFEEAKARNQKTMIITFANHPRLLFDPNCGLKQLTLCDERLELIEQTGIDFTLLIYFDRKFARLTSSEFLEMLKDKFSVETLIVGYDHHFGSDRQNGFEHYKNYGKQIGIDVIEEDSYSDSNISVSSTKIRNAILEGEIEKANNYLGYRYTVKGIVVKGNQIGRTIHYPTANININPLKLTPKRGVYATYTIIDGIRYKSMTNIGNRPTVMGDKETIETHIFNLDHDIYNSEITIEFIKHIRNECKFENIKQLECQLNNDKNTVLEILRQQ